MNVGVLREYWPLYMQAAGLTLGLGLAGILLATAVGLLCAAVQFFRVPFLRRIVQFYIDGKPQGIPFDMRSNGESTKIGWQAEGSDPEQNAAFDKQFHYRGWMKGPKAYSCTASSTSMRDLNNTLRRVIGQFHSTGKEHHVLRMQQKMKGAVENTCDFDFIELCPSSIYNNPDLAEDVW